jgi:hypothetical protein
VTFHAFDGLGSKGGFKAAYRRALDELMAAPDAYRAVVAEVRLADQADGRVSEAVGRRLP